MLPDTPEDTPVVAAVFLRLGGDGRQFDILELRGAGPQFSRGMTPRVVITNAIDIRDDTRYAEGEFSEDDVGTTTDVLNRYRRKVHLIDDSLRAVNDSFDFASELEFPEVGLEVSVEELGQGSTGAFNFALAHLHIHWERGKAIDLGFIDSLPDWQSPDIAILKPDEFEDDSFEFPEEQPEIETYRVPMSPDEGPLTHKILARVWNFGDSQALNVQVDLVLRRPAGAGDYEAEVIATDVIDEVGTSTPEIVDFDWDVEYVAVAGESCTNPDTHVCWRVQIGDRDVPQGSAGALASDDTTPSNDWAQQNVFSCEAAASSPPKPVEFNFRVYNDGPFKEDVMLVPKGLGEGARLSVTPGEMRIPRKSAGVFRIRVELEEGLLSARCGKDITFLLEAWRLDDHAYERWGASKYTILPRLATKTILEGGITPGGVGLHLWGAVEPDIGAIKVLLHIQLPDQAPLWEEVTLGPGATFDFTLPAEIPPLAEVRATARFEGTREYASSVSETLNLKWWPAG